MDSTDFAALVAAQLPYSPNSQQTQVIGALARFCFASAPEDSVFLLNGYAGTGKTSLCGALVRALPMVGIGTMLLAPTGRAAKVFGNYAGKSAYTIHRIIYRHPGIGATGFGARDVAENNYTDTLFIVDEASMISDAESNGFNLLQDLIHFVYTGHGCRLLLLGDTAQLPPVGCAFSPAMSVERLKAYGLRVTRATLTEIARQGAESGILRNATWLRRAMKTDPLPAPRIFSGYSDVKQIEGEDMPEELYNAYSNDGVNDTIVITRSNMRAVGFNREIRASVLYFEESLCRDELLIVAKNNYFWSDKIKELNFIANGDMLQVDQVYGTQQKYGFRFCDVRVTIPETEISFDAKVMLDTLDSETASLSQEQVNKLYYAIMEDPELFGPYTPADARLKALKTNPYWNALQVKYGYAVTCHKAQGGQWKNVFVDMSYIPEDAMGMEFYRWLYTAETRATTRLFILK